MVNVVKFENIGPRSGSGVRQSLNFGMPDARKPHRPYVGLGSRLFSNSGLAVKLSVDAPVGFTVLSAVGARPSA